MTERPPDKSWLERTFGLSPETTLPAFGAAFGMLLAVVGILLESKEMTTIGLTATAAALVIMGQQARSQKQHERDESRHRPPPKENP